MASRFNLNTTLFHFSREHPNDFMRAPTIHLGDATGAAGRSADTNSFRVSRGEKPTGAVYALDSTHMNIDPDLTLTDKEVNTTERLFLKGQRLPVPPVTDASAVLAEDYETEGIRTREVYGALKALRENRAVRYENSIEGGTSVLAPTAHMNTHILDGGRAVSPRDVLDHSDAEGGVVPDRVRQGLHSDDMHDSDTIDTHLTQPRSNPSLPMNWSTLDQSEITTSGGLRED